jgi:hypothetical protein
VAVQGGAQQLLSKRRRSTQTGRLYRMAPARPCFQA